jgi:glutathione S-transferase
MKLYVMPGACSLASHIALLWADIPFDLVILGHEDLRGEAFLSLNPKGAVPTLVLGDGSVITESLALLEYIADQAPAVALGAAPDDPMGRARLNESLAELVSDVHKAWAPVFVPDRFTITPSGEADVTQAAFAQLDLQYSRLDAVMASKQWRVLGRRTVADAYLYVMCSWKDRTPTPLSSFPNLAAFKARLGTDPAVMRALASEAATPGRLTGRSAPPH